MGQFELPVGTLDPALSAIGRHLRIATDRPEEGSSGFILVSQGPDAPARFLPNGTSPPVLHLLADTTGLGAQHSTIGLAAGQVLRASGATAANFQRLTAADVDPGTFVTGSYTFGGTTFFQGQIASTVVTGTAPLTIQSTTLVANLNTDLLDGLHASAFALASHTHGKADLPAAIAYEDEANTFSLTQTFGGLVSITGGKLLIDGVDATFSTSEIGWLENAGNLIGQARGAMFFTVGPADAAPVGRIWVFHSGTAFTDNVIISDAGRLSVQRRLQVGQLTDQTDRLIQLVGAAGNTSGLSQYGIVVSSGVVFGSDATTETWGHFINFGSTNAVYTTTSAGGLRITALNLGASQTVTSLYGIKIDGFSKAGGTSTFGLDIGNVSGATNNFAIRTGTGKVQFGDVTEIQSGGLRVTAGNVGIGTAPSSLRGLYLAGSLTSGGPTQNAIQVETTFGTDSVTRTNAARLGIRIPAVAATFSEANGVLIDGLVSVGAGASVTSYAGVHILSTTVAPTGNHYGVVIEAVVGATNNYAIYTNAGLVRLGDATTIVGDATLNARLLFTTAASKIVAGATSFALRDNADTANNLLLTNAGLASFRNNVTITTAGSTDGLAITRPTGTPAGINLQTSGSGRWGIYVTEAAESGADAGSNFRLRARTDAGVFIDDPITVVRAGGGTITLNRDVVIGSLGRFDSTDVPLESQILLYHAGATNKWQAESLQLIYNAGDAAVALLVDNTSTQFLYFDPGAGADSPVGAPPVPVLKLFATHKGVTVAAYASTAPDVFYHDGPSYPADFRHFLYEYSTDNFVADTKSLATASSDKVNHGRLTVGTTYYYRARAVDRAGNASANSATVSFVAVASSDTSNFGVVLATEIAVDRLAALSANIGIITAGQMRNAGNTAGVNLGGAGGIPGTWTHGINLEAAAGSGSMTRYLNFTATGAQSFLKHERLEMNVDGVVKMYGSSGRTVFNLTAADYYLQQDAVTPLAGVLVMGTLPGSWTRYLSLVGSGTFLKHERLQVDYDGTVLMYQSSAQPLFKLNASDFLLQNDAASPTQGILIDGTRPAGWLRYLDLVDGVFAASDAQGSPVLRVRAGKVGAGPSDYGLQVFDVGAATIMDFTGAKRILAVPVQPPVDSGASITLDLSTGLTQQVRLTNSAATVRMQNPTNGARYRIWLQQDTTGSRPYPKVVLDSTGDEAVMYSNDTSTGPNPTRPTLTTEPGAFDLYEFEYRTTPTARFTAMALQTAVRLPCPLVQSVTPSSFGSATTSHLVAMPATVDAGDLLLMLFARVGTSAVTTPTGWSLIASQNRLYVFAKDAVGTEDGTTVDVVTATGETAAAQVYRITRWGGTVPTHINASFAAQTTNANPDPPAHAPGWSVDRNLWIAAFGANGGTTTAYPINYASGTETNSGAGDVTLASARRAWYATSENPGTFELLASQTWDACTIAVRPPL